MAESNRGFRGRGGGGRGGDHGGRGGGGRGGGRGGGNQGQRSQGNHQGGGGQKGGEEKERPKRDNILDLNKYLDKKMRIKFSGGREVTGLLKGFDQLMNLVLDEVEEIMRDEEGNEGKRSLGLIVARGPLVTLISPYEGSEEISNPFVQAADDDDDDEGGGGGGTDSVMTGAGGD